MAKFDESPWSKTPNRLLKKSLALTPNPYMLENDKPRNGEICEVS